jgi:hypothetical protein
VDVAPVGDLAITQCPHTYTINGVVSVNRGPETLTYGWKIDGAAPTHQHTVQFSGHGSQSRNVSLDYSISGYMRTTTTFHQVTTGVPGGIAAKVEITSAGGFKTVSTPATCS